MVTVIQNQKVEKRRDANPLPSTALGRTVPGRNKQAVWNGSAARLDPLFDSGAFNGPGPILGPELFRHPEKTSRPKRFEGIESGNYPLLAALLLVSMIMALWYFQPVSYLRGLTYSASITLPADTTTDQLLAKFSSSMSEEDVSVPTDDFDPAKLEPLHLQNYTVKTGDSLSGIADKFNLNIDSIISFNNISDPRRIRLGQTYKIPNRDGLQYTTKPGDTLEKIAKRFDVSVTALLDGNDLKDETVAPNTTLFIPGARLNPTDLKLMLGELFRWPVKGFYLTSGYGYRSDPFTGQRRFHNGQDIGAYQGAPILAAEGGRVVMVETQVGNYGKMVMIRHDRGFVTLYGHLDSFAVQVGQYVKQGQMIGRMGNTGRSTGTHLHFSVLRNGVYVNPRKYLP